jgi:D-alanine-D-alanine ligase
MNIHNFLNNDYLSNLITSLGKVGVLMGGVSSEREISLKSGNEVYKSLKSIGFDVVAIDVDSDPVSKIQLSKINYAFIALHGRGGEDGLIQAVLEQLNIPYTGSGVLGSALAMDKVKSKQIWQGLNLPTSPFEVLKDKIDYELIKKKLGENLFVKPIKEGSSYGMSIVKSNDELKKAYSSANVYGEGVFVEKLILGPEYSVSILDGFELPSIKINTEEDFYNFDAKYKDNKTEFLIPSGLSESEENKIQKISRNAFDALGCEGWGRVDFMRDEKSGEFLLLEVNTVPGLTSHSLLPMAANAKGISFEALLIILINNSMGEIKND